MVERHVITFLGRVQGVGFRVTTRRIASDHPIVGWVRNEPDGSVTCVAEGEAASIERFVAEVERAMDGCVRDRRVERTEARGDDVGFEIR